MTEFNRHKFRLSLICTALAVLFVGFGVGAASPKNRIDAAARQAKAHRLVEAGEALLGENVAMSQWLLEQAEAMEPEDSLVRMAVNNIRLMQNPLNNPAYFAQLDLLNASSDPSRKYYFILSQNTYANPPADSLTDYRTALAAYRRFPDSELFIQNVLNAGSHYVLNHRFKVRNDGQDVDTLILSPEVSRFADNLLALADTMEQQNGYLLEVDEFRLNMLNVLGREDELAAAEKAVWQRDSTDMQLLSVLMNLAYNRGESDKLSRLGLQQFKLQPDNKRIYAVYAALPNDSLRQQVMDAVLETASDTDGDASSRMELLHAAATVYYMVNDTAQVAGNTNLPKRLSDAAREITLEDPTDLGMYIEAILLARTPDWGSKYGYKHWIDAFDALPDSLTTHLALTQEITSVMDKPDAEFESRLKKLIKLVEKERPDFALDSKIILGQYYVTSEQPAKALEVFKPITLDDVRMSEKLHDEYEKTHGSKQKTDDEPDFEDPTDTSDDRPFKRWIGLQSIISDCQMKLRKIDDAFATMNGIVALDPKNAEILNNLAYYMCLEGHDLNVALNLVNRSLDEKPDNFNAIDTRAWIYYNLGKTDEALTDMASLFSQYDVSVYDDVLAEEPKAPLADVFKTFNQPVISPMLGHLLLIAEKSGKYSQSVLMRLADYLREIDPKNEDLLIFDSHIKR